MSDAFLNTMQTRFADMRYDDNFKPGIRFYDTNWIGEQPELLGTVLLFLKKAARAVDAEVIAGPELRGCTFGMLLAGVLGIPFYPIRKKGKLPGDNFTATYETEYSKDVVQMRNGAELVGKRVLVVDDLLASGGTAHACFDLIGQNGGIVAGLACIVELIEFIRQPNGDPAGRSSMPHIPVMSYLSVRNKELILTDNLDLRLCVDPIVVDQFTSHLVLIERLEDDNCPGLAMAGGGIDFGESIVDTIIREIWEELKLAITPDQVQFHTVLAGADRDERGDQISYVCVVKHTGNEIAVGEAGKTKPYLVSMPELLRKDPNLFAFNDHYPVLEAYARKQKSRGVDEIELA